MVDAFFVDVYPLEERALREQLERERLLDMEKRLADKRRAAFVVLGLSLVACGPWIGWWWLVPLALATCGFLVTDRRVQRSESPMRWATASWAASVLMIAMSVALTGGPDSPGLPWFALPTVTAAVRFRRRGLVLAILYTIVCILASTIPVDPAAVFDDPTRVFATATMIIAAVILSMAVAQSDRDHREEAVLDPLTGLLNRAALAQRFAELEQQALRNPRSASIGFVIGDLDHFKEINDSHGHDVGDDVLRQVADAVQTALRAFDLVYRVGGEEFVVLLPGARGEDTAEVAERVRAAAEACSRPGVPVSMSLGVATSTGVVDFDALYKRADRALYEAKQAGRNRVCVAGATQTEPAFAAG